MQRSGRSIGVEHGADGAHDLSYRDGGVEQEQAGAQQECPMDVPFGYLGHGEDDGHGHQRGVVDQCLQRPLVAIHAVARDVYRDGRWRQGVHDLVDADPRPEAVYVVAVAVEGALDGGLETLAVVDDSDAGAIQRRGVHAPFLLLLVCQLA